MNKKRRDIFLIVLLTILLNSCSKDSLFDFVVGGQPTFIGDHKFVPGLNIFAVIRPDSLDKESMTLIHIEKIIPTISDVSDSFTVVQLSAVMYIKSHGIIKDSLSFNYNYPDTIITHMPPNSAYKAGEQFNIICKSPGLPTLTAEAIMPNQPVLSDSIIYNNNKIMFSIAFDTSTFLYDVYVVTSDNQFKQRIIRASAGNTKVELEVNLQNTSNASVMIYAYDKNLSEYLTVTNLFIKPNTYRPPFTTVHNGYGCFGSMNILTKKITFSN